MYLETTHALGEGVVGNVDVLPLITCPQGTPRAGQQVRFMTDISSDCGVVRTPVRPTPSISLFSYDLTGTPKSWSYSSCRSGYTRKLSGKPHPNYYTCFKSTGAQVSAPVQTRCAPVRWNCSDGTQRMAHTDSRPPSCDPCSDVGLSGTIM